MIDVARVDGLALRISRFVKVRERVGPEKWCLRVAAKASSSR